MAEPKERSHYWLQVGSVLLGAVIAAVTSAVITHMQGRSQLRQTALQNQLNALRDKPCCSIKKLRSFIIEKEILLTPAS